MSASSVSAEEEEGFSRLSESQLDELDVGLPKFWRELDPDAELASEDIVVHNFLEQHHIDGSRFPGVTESNRPHWASYFADVKAHIKLSNSRVRALENTSEKFAMYKSKLQCLKAQHSAIARSLNRYKATCTDEVHEETIYAIEQFIKRQPSILPILLKELSAPGAECADAIKELEERMVTIAMDVAQLQSVQDEHVADFELTHQLARESRSTVEGLAKEMRILRSYESECASEVKAQKELESLRSEVETLRKQKADVEQLLLERELHLNIRVERLEISLSKSENELRIKGSALDEYETKLQDALGDLDVSKEDHAITSRTLEITELQLRNCRSELAAANSEVEAIKIENVELDTRITRNNSLILQLGEDQTAAAKTKADLRQELERAKTSQERLVGFNSHYKQALGDIKKEHVSLTKEKTELEKKVFDCLAHYNAQNRELMAKTDELEATTERVRLLEARCTRVLSDAKATQERFAADHNSLQAKSSHYGRRVKELKGALASSIERLDEAETTIQSVRTVLDPKMTGRTPLQLAESQWEVINDLRAEMGDLQQWKSRVEDSRSRFHQDIFGALFAGTVLHEASTLHKFESDWSSASQLGEQLQHHDICLDVESFHPIHGMPPVPATTHPTWVQALLVLGQIYCDTYEVSVGDVEAIGISLRSCDYHSVKLVLILLYRFVRLRYDMFEPDDSSWPYSTSIVVLRAMEILASHIKDGAAFWQLSRLFETIQVRLSRDTILVKILTESVRCRFEQTTPSMRDVVESVTAQTFLSAAEYMIGLENENIILVDGGGDVAVISPEYFKFRLDAIEGWYVTFNEAPLVGTWKSPYWPHEAYLQDVLAFSASIFPKALDEIEEDGAFVERWVDKVH